MSYEEKESLNEVTKRWKNCIINDTSQDPYIWFYEPFNLNLKSNNINENYEKYEDDPKAHVFDVLPEFYKTMRVS